MLLNLLDNAIKYNFGGGSLSISLTKSGGLAVLRIANLGPGIPKEHEARVFERFYRAGPSRSSDTSGSGLGLSICREIVVAHGGQMWLDQPGSGWTAFFVTLRLMEGHPLEEPFSRRPDKGARSDDFNRKFRAERADD